MTSVRMSRVCVCQRDMRCNRGGLSVYVFFERVYVAIHIYLCIHIVVVFKRSSREMRGKRRVQEGLKRGKWIL